MKPPPFQLQTDPMAHRRALVTFSLIPFSLVVGFFGAYVLIPAADADLVESGCRWWRQSLLFVSVLIPILLCLLWRHARDEDNQLWWFYGPFCGLWLMAAHGFDLWQAYTNVVDDSSAVQIAAPIRFVEGRPIYEYRFRKRRYQRIGGVHVYLAVADPWRRGWNTSFYWHSVDLPRPVADTRNPQQARELAEAHAPDWRGKCLFATVGQGTHDWRWISRERRIGACPTITR